MQRAELKNGVYFMLQGNTIDVYRLMYTTNKQWIIARVLHNDKILPIGKVIKKTDKYFLCHVRGLVAWHQEKIQYENMIQTPYTLVQQLVNKFVKL